VDTRREGGRKQLSEGRRGEEGEGSAVWKGVGLLTRLVVAGSGKCVGRET
jgi:hypothetical protein